MDMKNTAGGNGSQIAPARGNESMDNLAVANTIMAQLGGRRFQVMTGSRNFMGYGIDGSGGLRFGLARNKSGANCCRIDLDRATDTYTVKFFGTRGSGVTLRVVDFETISGVYADQLTAVFERVTGLATSLGTMGQAVAA